MIETLIERVRFGSTGDFHRLAAQGVLEQALTATVTRKLMTEPLRASLLETFTHMGTAFEDVRMRLLAGAWPVSGVATDSHAISPSINVGEITGHPVPTRREELTPSKPGELPAVVFYYD